MKVFTSVLDQEGKTLRQLSRAVALLLTVTFFTGCADFTLFVLPGTGHNHNVAPDRLVAWGARAATLTGPTVPVIADGRRTDALPGRAIRRTAASVEGKLS